MWNNINNWKEKNLKFYKIMLIQMENYLFSIGLFIHFGHTVMARSAFTAPTNNNTANLSHLNLTDIYETAANDVSKAIKKAINILTSVHDDAISEHEQHEPIQQEEKEDKPHNVKVKELPLIHLSDIEELNKQYFDDFDIDLGSPHKYKSYLTDPAYEKNKPGSHLSNKHEPEPERETKSSKGDEEGEHETESPDKADPQTDSPPKSSDDYDYEDETPEKVSHKEPSARKSKSNEDYEPDDESEPEKSSQNPDEEEIEDETPSKKKSKTKSKPTSKPPHSDEDYDYDDNTSSEAPKTRSSGKKSRTNNEDREEHPQSNAPFRPFSISYSDDIKHGEHPSRSKSSRHALDAYTDELYGNSPLKKKKPRSQPPRRDDDSHDEREERDNNSSRNRKGKRKNRKSTLSNSDDNRKHDQHQTSRDSKGRSRYNSGGGGRASKADCPDD